MKSLKKFATVAVMTALIGAMSITSFASPSNPGVPARDGSGGRGAAAGIARRDGTYAKTGVRPGSGQGATGNPQGLGVGGMMLQDGSCYTVE